MTFSSSSVWQRRRQYEERGFFVLERVIAPDHLHLLPYDRVQTRERVEHVRDETTQDLVGYFGTDPGEPVIAPAGSIAVFSSVTFHRSGSNTSKGIRRIFLPQYSAEPVLNAERTAPLYIAEPFLKEGRRVTED